MSRLWFLLLAASLGLNAGLLYVHLSRSESSPTLPPRQGPPAFDGSQPPMEEMMARHRERLADRLDLDEGQRDQLASIHQKLAPLLGQRRRSMMTLREEMARALGGETVDVAKVRELRRRISLQQADLDSIVAETILSEADLLSPEQRQLFLEVLPLMHGQGMGPRGPGARRLRP